MAMCILSNWCSKVKITEKLATKNEISKLKRFFFDFNEITVIRFIRIGFFVSNLLTETKRRSIMKVSQAVANFLKYQKLNAKKKHCQELSAFPKQV